jgi:pyruvate/2-oxoglutarate dehydrogenase complex dihydrolipoamide dehydrogenase (E3) component
MHPGFFEGQDAWFIRTDASDETFAQQNGLVYVPLLHNALRAEGSFANIYLFEGGVDAPGIYALGDIKGGPAFTHISYDDYRIVRDNLLKGAHKTTDGRLVPYTVFTDPQLGRVGLSEGEARAQGYNVKVAKLPMSRVARALETDETRGFMKAVVNAETGQILGAAILGLEGGEVVSVLQMAMMGRVPYSTIRDSAFAHPTLAESLNNLFMTLD